MHRFWIFGAAAVVALGGVAAADTITLSAVKDATIYGTAGGTDTGNASGQGPILSAGADGSLNVKRGLIQFNVSGATVLANATITNVTLTLYLAQVAGSGGPNGGGTLSTRTLRLFDLQQNWTEGTSGSPTGSDATKNGMGFARSTGDTTWDYASFNSADPTAGTWKTGNTNLHGGNFSAMESAVATFTSFTLNSAFNWSMPGMVTDVQSWVNGTAVNNGWLIKSDLEATATSFLAFWTKEGAAANANPAIAPQLTITYTPAPEPASLLTLLAAPLLMLRKRGRSGR